MIIFCKLYFENTFETKEPILKRSLTNKKKNKFELILESIALGVNTKYFFNDDKFTNKDPEYSIFLDINFSKFYESQKFTELENKIIDLNKEIERKEVLSYTMKIKSLHQLNKVFIRNTLLYKSILEIILNFFSKKYDQDTIYLINNIKERIFFLDLEINNLKKENFYYEQEYKKLFNKKLISGNSSLFILLPIIFPESSFQIMQNELKCKSYSLLSFSNNTTVDKIFSNEEDKMIGPDALHQKRKDNNQKEQISNKLKIKVNPYYFHQKNSIRFNIKKMKKEITNESKIFKEKLKELLIQQGSVHKSLEDIYKLLEEFSNSTNESVFSDTFLNIIEEGFALLSSQFVFLKEMINEMFDFISKIGMECIQRESPIVMVSINEKIIPLLRIIIEKNINLQKEEKNEKS